MSWCKVLAAGVLLLGGCLAQNQRDKVCKKDNGFFPHEQYCDYYYECVDGQATLQLCPNGLAFTGKGRGLLNNCDYPHRAQCPDEDGHVMGQSPITHGNCPWMYGVFPHQTSCTRYWQCWNSTATVQQCPFSLLFNDVLHSCDWPDNVPDCQKHPICKDQPNGRIPIQNACVRYWLCVGGYPRLQRCAAGLAFSATNLRCELDHLVAGCEPVSTPHPDDEAPAEQPPARPAPQPRPQPAQQYRPAPQRNPAPQPQPVAEQDQSLGNDQSDDDLQDAPPPPRRRQNIRPRQQG